MGNILTDLSECHCINAPTRFLGQWSESSLRTCTIPIQYAIVIYDNLQIQLSDVESPPHTKELISLKIIQHLIHSLSTNDSVAHLTRTRTQPH